MNLGGAWKPFLLRIKSEFAVSDYSIFTGDGAQMMYFAGRDIDNILLERYLSFETTVTEADQTECRLITRFIVGDTVYLIVLYSADPNGFSENETDYILQDITALQEQLRHSSSEQSKNRSTEMKKGMIVLWAVITLLLVVGAFLIGYKLMKSQNGDTQQIQTTEVESSSVSDTSPVAQETTFVSNEATSLTELFFTTTTETTETTTALTTTMTLENTVTYPDDYSFVMSGYVSTKELNLMMRMQPDADAECVFDEGIKRGTPVEVYGTSIGSDGSMWYFVKYNGFEGWCKAVYITKEAPELLPKDTAQPDYLVPDTYLEYPLHCETVVGELNLRSGPGEGYSSYLRLPKGVELEEIGYNYNNSNWIFTCYNGQYGWAKTNNNGKTYIQFYGGIEKPVIYLYPIQDTVVNVKLSLKTSTLATTYPAYGNGWNVLAKPDGSLVNLADGSHHSYLFWDSCNDRTHYDLSTGFCVRGDETESFLKKKLRFMGLTESEMNDFVVYWLPKMEHNNYNLISFQKDTYEEAAELTVSPKPDSILRVFMAYVPLEKEIGIEPQKLDSFERRGYTVVEWGGTELNTNKHDT